MYPAASTFSGGGALAAPIPSLSRINTQDADEGERRVEVRRSRLIKQLGVLRRSFESEGHMKGGTRACLRNLIG